MDDDTMVVMGATFGLVVSTLFFLLAMAIRTESDYGYYEASPCKEGVYLEGSWYCPTQEPEEGGR